MTIVSKDLTSAVSPLQTLVPATRNTAATGSTIDMTVFDSAVVVVAVGALVDGTHSVTVQDSDDGTTWANVNDGQLVGTFTNLTANSVQRVGYLGIRRYLRANSASSGATGCTFGAVIVRGNPRTGPTS